MSTGSTTAAVTGEKLSAANPARSDDPMPLRQRGLTTTVAPDNSAVVRTWSAAAPSTTTTGAQPPAASTSAARSTKS